MTRNKLFFGEILRYLEMLPTTAKSIILYKNKVIKSSFCKSNKFLMKVISIVLKALHKLKYIPIQLLQADFIL